MSPLQLQQTGLEKDGKMKTIQLRDMIKSCLAKKIFSVEVRVVDDDDDCLYDANV